MALPFISLLYHMLHLSRSGCIDLDLAQSPRPDVQDEPAHLHLLAQIGRGPDELDVLQHASAHAASRSARKREGAGRDSLHLAKRAELHRCDLSFVPRGVACQARADGVVGDVRQAAICHDH